MTAKLKFRLGASNWHKLAVMNWIGLPRGFS